MWRVGANNIAFSVNGTKALDLSVTSLSFTNGIVPQFTAISVPDSTTATLGSTPTGVSAGLVGWFDILIGGVTRHVPYWGS